MDLGPHATFIIAAYAVTALIVAILIVWIAGENCALKRTLAELEARGITRRSDERKAASRQAETRKSEAHSVA